MVDFKTIPWEIWDFSSNIVASRQYCPHGKDKGFVWNNILSWWRGFFLQRRIGKNQCYIYCRVSNTKQKQDLEKQEQLLREYCVKNGTKPDLVLSDIGSGMKEDRKNFQRLITLVKEGKVDTVYISYKDRLTRFGFDYFDYIFNLFVQKLKWRILQRKKISNKNLHKISYQSYSIFQWNCIQTDVSNWNN